MNFLSRSMMLKTSKILFHLKPPQAYSRSFAFFRTKTSFLKMKSVIKRNLFVLCHVDDNLKQYEVSTFDSAKECLERAVFLNSRKNFDHAPSKQPDYFMIEKNYESVMRSSSDDVSNSPTRSAFVNSNH